MSPFAVLGIAPTDDKRAIKRAYAAKLKATDVEGDPKAFIALREALNNATWEADYIDDYYGDVAVDDAVEEEQAAPESDTIPDTSPITDAEVDTQLTHQQRRERDVLGYIDDGANKDAPDPEPVIISPSDQEDIDDDNHDDDVYDEDPATWRWEPQRQPATEAEQEKIINLLWGHRSAEDIRAELAEATYKILTAPEMEAIDHASAIEDWMASIIAQSVPKSDPMTRIAVPHFGWAETADDWRQRYGVSQATARFIDLEALDRLEKPDHRWHDAWQLLKQPPPDAYGWKAAGKQRDSIVSLLQSIRTHYPALESELDAEHVATWDAAAAAPAKKSGGWNFRWWWWVLIALYAFVQIARFAGDSVPPNRPIPTTEEIKRITDEVRPLTKSPPTQAELAAPATKMVYSSPVWRGEQAPRVQRWMDDNPDALDRLLQPHVKAGGLPSCAKLSTAAGMSPNEASQCRKAEAARLAAMIARKAEVRVPTRPDIVPGSRVDDIIFDTKSARDGPVPPVMAPPPLPEAPPPSEQ